jgi:ribonuclease-3
MRKLISFWNRIRNPHPRVDGDFLYRLQLIMGVQLRKSDLYRMALRHKSSSEVKSGKGLLSNERLEYLGDSVLSTVISDFLYKAYPSKDEGFLTRTRAKLVSRAELNKLGNELGLLNLLSAEISKGKNQARYLSGNALEALIGALYLDRGYAVTRSWIIEKLYAHLLNLDELEQMVLSYRSQLMEWCQKNHFSMQFVDPPPSGPEHRKTFYMEVWVNNEKWGEAQGFSKKDAKEKACERAFLERVKGTG